VNLITDIQYFPSVILFKNLNKITNIIFEQYDRHQKMSFRNRCQLAGADGIIQLSIPLGGGRDQRTIMKEVRIANKQDWQGQHWKTIVSCYSRSPWFEFYRDDLFRLYQRPFTFLLDWDLECFEWVARMLGRTLEISITDSYREDYDKNEWLDLRGKIGPRTIGQLQESAPAPKYRQVFEERTGFLPGLSILDLLFCEGKNASRYIGGIS